MTGFIHQDFLLSTDPSRRLYHDYATHLPIIDYHNHLPAGALADNQKFDDITALWLAGDHYKWRALRANGVKEFYITGAATSKEKFMKWAATVPYTLGNPLYHWTHLELKRYFEIDQLLNEENGAKVFNHCNEMIAQDEFRSQNLLLNKKVEIVCTTDDPADDLDFHRQLRQTQQDLKVLPTFRPDRMWDLKTAGYIHYLEKLSRASDHPIESFQDLIEVAETRIKEFHDLGCRLADHGLSYLPAVSPDLDVSRRAFSKVLNQQPVDQFEWETFQITLLTQLCEFYASAGWTQQFHVGAIRNNNTRMYHEMGANTGYDSIGDWNHVSAFTKFLDQLNTHGNLTKTIIYNSNPIDNASFATMMGNFNEAPVPGKMQFGASWWFLDQYHGIVQHLHDLSNYGLLSRFVGMLTDSRSFLSFTRHEYFRRILCDELGKGMNGGRLPNDYDLIGTMVQNICYFNAKSYFDFE